MRANRLTLRLLGVQCVLLVLAVTAQAETTLDARSKIEPALFDLLAAKGDTETVPIALWLVQEDDTSDLMVELREAGERGEDVILAEARARMAQTQQGVVGFLSGRGFEPTYASVYAPLVFAEPSKSAILDVAQRADVDAVYLSREYEEMIDHAAKSIRADVVWARGVTGTGVQIAVAESGRIEFNNPYLANGATHLPAGPVSDHVTAVAGIIVANDGAPSDRWKGVAWGAPALLSANSVNALDAPRIAAIDWAVSNGARVINMSVGKDTDRGLVAMDRYLDYIVRNSYRTIVVAAGNEAGGWGTGTDNVTSPGTAYNVITVGSFVDQNTTRWPGDGISNFSSWRDPRVRVTNVLFNGNSTGLAATVLTDAGANFGAANSLVGRYLNPNTVHDTSFLITANTATTITVSDMHSRYDLTDWATVGDPYQVRAETEGDREKPEVAACGDGDPLDGPDDIVSTSHVQNAPGQPAPWISNAGDGTSFAAPQVTGTAALIISRANADGNTGLQAWPEAIKAIIMASACHSLEVAVPGEKTGAGGVVACEADEVVHQQQYHHQFVTASDFAGPGGYWSRVINVQQGLKARVVLSWDANPVRNVLSGTSTGLTATTLTDNTSPFGPNNSKVGWVLNPDTSQQAQYFSVVSNTATTLTVSAGSDMTAVATVGDTYRLVSYPKESLDAELDLWIWDPVAAGYVASSTSTDNNYEIAEFTPNHSGAYEVRVFAIRFGGTTEPIGLAWAQEPCCSPDWGDAPDDMMHCEDPAKGDFPTKLSSNGARHTEFEVEWLSEDNTDHPGATWELDGQVDKVSKDQDEVSNIVSADCKADQDKEDDGVEVNIQGARGRATFWVNSATPNLGRYDAGRADERIYVTGWFDWNGNGSWANAAPERAVRWRGGPGTVGEALVGKKVEGCDMWNTTDHQKKVVIEFPVPQPLNAEHIWVRFRLDYGEDINNPAGQATYGEVEDYVFEVDEFKESEAEIVINTPLGVETIFLAGPTSVLVNLSNLEDRDGDGKEEVLTEMMSLELSGYSDLVESPVKVRLRSDTELPFMPTLGEIEETANNTPGVLDLPPFADTGTAMSNFDVFVEVEIGGEVLHNEAPKPMEGEISQKPPWGGTDTYFNSIPIDLLNEDGGFSGVSITATEHTPDPGYPFFIVDQVHLEQVSSELFLGQQGSADAVVELDFAPVPGAAVIFRKHHISPSLDGAFDFVNGEIVVDGSQTVLTTDATGHAQVQFTATAPGQGIIEAHVAGTDLSAFFRFAIQALPKRELGEPGAAQSIRKPVQGAE